MRQIKSKIDIHLYADGSIIKTIGTVSGASPKVVRRHLSKITRLVMENWQLLPDCDVVKTIVTDFKRD